LAPKPISNDAVKTLVVAMRDQAITIIKRMTGILIASTYPAFHHSMPRVARALN